MTLEELINKNNRKLNENDLSVLRYIMQNRKECQTLSISELSKRCNISAASIVRLTQKLGFSGYGELKYTLKSQQPSVRPKTDFLQLLEKDIEATKKLLRTTDFQPFLSLMRTSGRIFLYGTGYSQRNMMQEFSIYLISCDLTPILIPARHELENQIKYMRQGDLIIIASYSGDIASYAKSMRTLNLMDIPIISITSFSKNELSSFTPYNLYYYATPLTPDGPIIRTSYITLNLVLDTLYRKYLEYIIDDKAEYSFEIE